MVAEEDFGGMSEAIRVLLADVAWQRCQIHLQQNAQAYVPRVADREKVAVELRAVFNGSTRREVTEKLAAAVAAWRGTAPRLAAWAEESVPDGFTVFDLGLTAAQRKRLRTSNSCENPNQQRKRRTGVAKRPRCGTNATCCDC